MTGPCCTCGCFWYMHGPDGIGNVSGEDGPVRCDQAPPEDWEPPEWYLKDPPAWYREQRMGKVEADFPKDEEVVAVSTRACARLLAVLERLGVQPANPLNPLDAASFLLEGLADGVEQINSAVRKHEASKSGQGAPDLQDAGSDCPDDPNQEDEPSEEELEALDEVTHAAYCRVWSTAEAREADCDCGAGGPDDPKHEYDHGGEG